MVPTNLGLLKPHKLCNLCGLCVKNLSTYGRLKAYAFFVIFRLLQSSLILNSSIHGLCARIDYPVPRLHKHRKLCNLSNLCVRNLSTYGRLKAYAFFVIFRLLQSSLILNSSIHGLCARIDYPVPRLHKHRKLCNLSNLCVRNLSTYGRLKAYAFFVIFRLLQSSLILNSSIQWFMCQD
ncbi:hypothetical protein J577_3076 [Acinetobacter sp. 263903-1]|nr:hypothetical protein J577_3076 [Acinetobacter sp. 263903-1]